MATLQKKVGARRRPKRHRGCADKIIDWLTAVDHIPEAQMDGFNAKIAGSMASLADIDPQPTSSSPERGENDDDNEDGVSIHDDYPPTKPKKLTKKKAAAQGGQGAAPIIGTAFFTGGRPRKNSQTGGLGAFFGSVPLSSGDSTAEEGADSNALPAEFDEGVLSRYMYPIIHHFRTFRAEDHYFRTMLLPNRIFIIRMTSVIMALTFSVIGFANEHRRREGSWIGIYTGSLIMCLSTAFLVYHHRGREYIRWVLRNRTSRVLVAALESLLYVAASVWDFYSADQYDAVVGPTAVILIFLCCLISGLSATYSESLVGLCVTGALVVIKLAIIALGHGVHGALVYGLPFAVAVINCYGLLSEGDMAKRVRYIKTRCVEERLAQMKLERMKTDYLLSLSLPKSIVAKLRETGTQSFNLIAERIPEATVMFGDLKNFKEVAKHIGSTKEAVVLLNGIFQHMDKVIEEYSDLVKIKTISTKILFVGGLEAAPDHLHQMLDMALQFHEFFKTQQWFTIADERVPVKLDVCFGVAIGPLVAGIVGRKKFCYEIYGDVVNTAKAEQIVVTEKVFEKSHKAFATTCLGAHYVKGKGDVTVYNIDGPDPTNPYTSGRRFSGFSDHSTELENKLVSYMSTNRIDKTIVTSALAMTPLADIGATNSMAMAGKLGSVGAGGAGGGGGKRMSFAAAALEGGAAALGAVVANGTRFSAVGGLKGSTTTASSRLGVIPDANDSVPSLGNGTKNRLVGAASMGSLLAGPFSSDGVLDIGMGPGAGTAQTALDVAKMGSPLTLQLSRTGGGGAGPVDREFVTPRRRDGGKVYPDEGGSVDSVDQMKKLVVDVVLRMTAKVDRMGRSTTASSQRYMRVIYSEIRSFKIQYFDDVLEEKYRSDFTSSTWPLFLRGAAQAFFCELIFLSLAIYNTIASGNTFVQDSSTFYWVVGCSAASAGLQMLLVGVAVFGAGDEDPNDDFTVRFVMFLWTVFTFTTCAFTIVMPWSNLHDYPYLNGTVIPTLLFVFIIRLDGMLYLPKTLAACITTLALVITNLALHQTNWREAFFVFTCSWIWIAIEMLVERSRRIEYLLGLILNTQEELVADETAKSASVLHSILPQSVIFKLLVDPASIVYEEFDMMSILHMDVAGFTAMSSDLEPLTIVKMLNTLFTYFDHLVDEYNIEKACDAYVACSTLSPYADSKVGATSICLVALQMQAYVEHQLNTSPIVLEIVGKPLKMRIGIHTGPSCGAIMGGPKNFRYDLLGDTIILAEKCQERSPIGHVSITTPTFLRVQDYHGFAFSPPTPMEGIPGNLSSYVLQAADERIVTGGQEFDAKEEARAKEREKAEREKREREAEAVRKAEEELLAEEGGSGEDGGSEDDVRMPVRGGRDSEGIMAGRMSEVGPGGAGMGARDSTGGGIGLVRPKSAVFSMKPSASAPVPSRMSRGGLLLPSLPHAPLADSSVAASSSSMDKRGSILGGLNIFGRRSSKGAASILGTSEGDSGGNTREDGRGGGGKDGGRPATATGGRSPDTRRASLNV
ncbi:hypothetical protein HDV00_000504 [Rhizophlyctis rosea]|nr:hypothetical protein HDV00_000504 [Rhizophlyctis rosea]